MKCQALDLVETDFNMEIAHKFQISGQDLHPARIAPFLLNSLKINKNKSSITPCAGNAILIQAAGQLSTLNYHLG